MIELYVIATLVAVGFLINQNAKPIKQISPSKILQKELPSMENVYDSTYFKKADMIHRSKADKMFKESREKETKVLSKNYKLNEEDESSLKYKKSSKAKVTLLSGEDVDSSQFVHNNMVPFYGGKIRQNVDVDANSSKLESFTGVVNEYKSKQEVGCFFDQVKDLHNPYGNPVTTDFYQTRISEPMKRNNVTPIPKVQVGPGLNKGYSAEPTGGFHQSDYRDCILPKTVDDLRVVSKPKLTYEGRTVDGMKGRLPGKPGKVDKNRVCTYYKNTPDKYFITTGAQIKDKMNGKIIDKFTNRQDTTKEYIGSASSQLTKGTRMNPNVRKTQRQNFKDFGVRNTSMKEYGVGTNTDYGKKNIMVYNNQRTSTTARVRQGNLTTAIKALIAPIQDMLKITRKQGTIDNPRHFGNMTPQFPEKQTVYDPNDVARTTMKEMTLHEAALGNLKGHAKQTVYDPNDIARTTVKETTLREVLLGNLKGNEKLTVYDPNDVARTTVKETTLREALLGNLKGNEKLTVYDPNDVARTTVKETTLREALLGNLKGNEKLTVYDPNDVARTTMKEMMLHEAALGNLKGNEKLTVYDPNDVARTTMKEMMLHESALGNLKGNEKLTVYDPNDVARTTIKELNIDNKSSGILTGPTQIYVYDPDIVAKTTLRETMERMDYEMNLASKVYKGKVYDPDDKARTTMKELTEASTRDYIGSSERIGSKVTKGFEPKNTQKQFLSDMEHYGIAALGNKTDGDGYLYENFDAKLTHKQFLSDMEHYGIAEASTDKKQMSYDDIMNARIRSQKESTLHGREPTQEGAKVTTGPECLNVKLRDTIPCSTRQTHNTERIDNSISSAYEFTLTKEKQSYEQIEDDRLDPSILKAYIENPYTQPLGSVA